MARYSKDYYKILQIDPEADQEIIKLIYKKLAQLYHPDVNSSQEARFKMQEINEAYNLLKSPDTRAEYDAWHIEFLRGKNAQFGGSTEREWKAAYDQQVKDASAPSDASQKETAAPAEPTHLSHRHRRLPRTTLRRSIIFCGTVLFALIVAFALTSFGGPISCRFDRGQMFSNRLVLKNTSSQVFHDVSIRMDLGAFQRHELFWDWRPGEYKEILLDLPDTPYFIQLDFAAQEKAFSRYCYVEK